MNGKGSSPRKKLLFSVSFLSGVAIWAGVQGAADSFLSHPSFLVHQVEVTWPKGEKGGPTHFRLTPPTSIFRVELNSLRHAFQRRYPIADVVRVERVFPNRVRAVIRPRHVVAQIKAGGSFHLVSDDGMVVSSGSSSPRAGLPVLLLEEVRGPLHSGGNLAGAGFWRVADLLAALRRDGGIAGRRVSMIRVAAGDLFLSLEQGPEVRFSTDRVSAGWRRLAGLIAQRPQVLTEARYVDLRFADPVIGSETADKKPRRKKR